MSFRRRMARAENLPAKMQRAVTLARHGDVDGAIEAFRKVLLRTPGHRGASIGMRQMVYFSDAWTPTAIRALHEQTAVTLAPERGTPAPLRNTLDPDRPLRIGYHGREFQGHPMTRFVEPVLREHTRGSIEVHVFDDGRTVDPTTTRLRSLVPHWHSIAGLSDDRAATLIRSQEVDILICVGLVASRLGMYARRAAPVQTTWFPETHGTTGLPSMDYRIVDATTDPPGFDDHYTEQLVRMPRCSFVFQQNPALAVPVAPPPVLECGCITFGSTANPSKVSSRTLRMWGAVLRSVPGSRLWLVRPEFAELSCCRAFADRLALHGIPSVCFHVTNGAVNTIAEHDRIDILLDTLPFGGSTTTCAALWQGVPVVTMRGDRTVSNVSASMLRAAGLPELVADDEHGFVERAVALASDIPRLATMRAMMRERLGGSELCDYRGFARAFEDTLRSMWRTWCAEQRTATPRMP